MTAVVRHGSAPSARASTTARTRRRAARYGTARPANPAVRAAAAPPTPTTTIIVTATPEQSRPAKPASRPSQSRRSIGPSWSASSSCVSPNTSAPTNVIWNATRMFSAPAPKNTNATATTVASQGRTPARRITASTARRRRGAADDHERLIRRVAVQPDERPHEPVHEDRQRRPVLEVRAEQVAGVPGRARRQEVPVVLGEPTVAAPDQQERERDHLDRDEARQRASEQRPTRRRRRVGALDRRRLRVPA